MNPADRRKNQLTQNAIQAQFLKLWTQKPTITQALKGGLISGAIIAPPPNFQNELFACFAVKIK